MPVIVTLDLANLDYQEIYPAVVKVENPEVY